MREIKFRGRRSHDKEWVIGNLVIDNRGHKHIVPFLFFEEDGHHMQYEDDTDLPVFFDQETVGQFTGLHDKNGKELYEGDVIRSKNHRPEKMEIRFIEGGFCAWWGSDDYPIDINHFYDSKGCCFEVIGNIHENPELLNDL